MSEFKIIVLIVSVLAFVQFIIFVQMWEIKRFANIRKIEQICESSIGIYDFYKDICYRYGKTPKRNISSGQMLKEAKLIIEESKNEEDTNVYVNKTS